jgi:hypothetical protein
MVLPLAILCTEVMISFKGMFFFCFLLLAEHSQQRLRANVITAAATSRDLM